MIIYSIITKIVLLKKKGKKKRYCATTTSISAIVAGTSPNKKHSDDNDDEGQEKEEEDRYGVFYYLITYQAANSVSKFCFGCCVFRRDTSNYLITFMDLPCPLATWCANTNALPLFPFSNLQVGSHPKP